MILGDAPTPRATTLLLLASALLAWPLGAASNNLDAPTYADQVASILNERCISCHRPGQIGPMSLLSYDEVRPWAKSILRNVSERVMPPWHATGGTATFVNDRSLEPDEIETIVSWIKAGAPAGDLSKVPPPPALPEGSWLLGEPDFVVTLDEIQVPAAGPDQFERVVGTVALPDDKWISAVEILPGNAKVVHHVIALAIKGFDPDPTDGWLGAWAAGTEPMVFPARTGRLLPKGSNILADMHYHPTDTAARDITRIGLHFAEPSEVDKELTNLWVMNPNFEIPAGADNYEVRSSYTFWQDGKIMTLAPHMHYRGKDFKYVATWPDGRQETLLEVANWDFNWQTFYVLDRPIAVTEGTRVDCIAHFDNSAANPANPDPTKAVTFGNESFNEMMIGFVDFVVDQGVRPLTHREIRTQKIDELASRHPGQVYAISAKPPEKRSEPDSYAPLYLPREGEGTFYVIWDNQLQASRVYDIAWQGDSFAAKVESPWGPFNLDGTIEGGAIKTVLHLPEERDLPWEGELVR